MKTFRARILTLAAVVAILMAATFGAFLLPGHSTQHAAAVGATGYEGPGVRFTLVASAARTVTGVTPQVCGHGPYHRFAYQQVVTAASGTAPTLDTTIQHSIDNGANWYPLVTFTQRVATGTELKLYAEVDAATAQVVGDCLRLSYVITGTTPSFTFAVTEFAQ